MEQLPESTLDRLFGAGPTLDNLEHLGNAGLIEIGRIRSSVVPRYLEEMPDDDRPEAIAEAYRDRYATLRDGGLPADRIFLELWRFTGGEHFAGEPMKAAAVTAVRTYFFDRCDIFENTPKST